MLHIEKTVTDCRGDSGVVSNNLSISSARPLAILNIGPLCLCVRSGYRHSRMGRSAT